MQPFAGPSRPRLPPSRPAASASPFSSPTLSPTHSTLSVTPLVISPTSSSSTSQQRPLKSQIPGLPRRLLVPTSVPKCTGANEDAGETQSRPGSALGKHSHGHGHGHGHGKSNRSRANSAPPEPAQDPLSAVHRWFHFESNFEVVEENLQLVGYQIYAVEKWCAALVIHMPVLSLSLKRLLPQDRRPQEVDRAFVCVHGRPERQGLHHSSCV